MPKPRVKASQQTSPVKVVLKSSKYIQVSKNLVIDKRITHKNQLLPANRNNVKNYPKMCTNFTVTSATQPQNLKTNRTNMKINKVTSYKLPSSEIPIEMYRKEEPYSDDDDDGDENNDDQSMEIGEDWSFAEVSVSTTDNAKLRFLDRSTEDDVKKSENYVDLSHLLSGNADTDEQTVKELDEISDDDDEQAIIMADENGATIIRLGSNHRFPFENTQFKEEKLEENYNNSKDSYDESQVKSQVSDDEETAKPIIVGAEQEVETEMFQVEYAQSNPDDELEGTIQLVKIEDGKFRCLICDENGEENDSPLLTAAEEMMAHLKNRHDARLYICDCGKIMRKRSLYSAHIVEHMPKNMNDYRFECTVCLRRFKKKTSLEEHIYKHTGNRPYACDLCDKTFVNKYKHQAHLKTHEERPRPFECLQCGKAFFTQNNLNQHVKTHTRLRNFKCQLCQKTFASQSILEVHAQTHTGKRPYSCDICSKSFTTKAILQNHTKIHADKSQQSLDVKPELSTRERPHQCEYCSKYFTTKDILKNHIRIHTGERPYACDMCSATFTTQSNLLTHKRATHLKEKKYHCKECSKQFVRRRLLDWHTKSVHTGERPLQCNECPSTFINPEHLKIHMRCKHSDARPFSCEVCGKSFKLRYSRNIHRFVHSEKKPFECGTCGKGYGRKHVLLMHMENKGHKYFVENDPRLVKPTDTSPTSLQKIQLANRKSLRVDTNKPISDSET